MTIAIEALLELLACPACRAPLDSVAACSSCGTSFGDDTGTPDFTGVDASAEMTVSFSASRSRANEEGLAQVLRYPPRRGQDKSLPYHFDAAYADVIKSLPSGATVFEIGCGGGQTRGWVEGAGKRYIGADISKTRVHEWLQQHGGPDILCDAHFLPLRDQSVDLIYSAAVFEHLACPWLAAREVARALKPGGKFIGSVSFMEPWHDHSFFHMSPLGTAEMLEQAGLVPDYLWPGWSGFRALFEMGGPTVNPVAFVGDGLSFYHRATRRARDMVKDAMGKEKRDPIYEDAAVTGAMCWIASKPRPEEGS